MKIGLIQINPTVGDISGNADLVEAAVREAHQQGAQLCITSELALTGYPPRDLLLHADFLRRAQARAEELARDLSDTCPVLLGHVQQIPEATKLFNCALFLNKGKIEKACQKSLLPTYDVFDEDRYFQPGVSVQHVEVNGLRIAVTICEDLWNDKTFWQEPRYERDPLAEVCALKPDLLVNLSASPFTVGKQPFRESMLSSIAIRCNRPLVYVNQCGGNDDLVFDGRSCVFAPNGALLARAKGFEQDIIVVDTQKKDAQVIREDDFSPEAETFQALVCGTRDYVRKCGFSKVVLGLSGGIDSAVTAAVAAHAFGPENVVGVLMPSPYSSIGSVLDSDKLVTNLGIRSYNLPIEPIMKAFGETLSGPFAGREPDVTEENIQSRIRGNLLMAISNKFGSLLLTTGNKSELAVGYCTIYGDMAGALAVIADVPKTAVFALANWLNKHHGPCIPEEIISKPPSAELRPDQKDEDSLPPYDILDEILRLHVEEHRSADHIISLGHDPDVVKRILWLVRINEFKRRQAAPGLKITNRAFGTGWRMPVACKLS